MTLIDRMKATDLLWQEMEPMVRRLGLPDRILYAVCDAAVGYRVRSASYRNLANVNNITASRDLKIAVDAGLLLPLGERRGRLYMGAPHIRAVFDRIKGEHIKPIADPFQPESKQLDLAIPLQPL
jgi:hypothetical protein